VGGGLGYGSYGLEDNTGRRHRAYGIRATLRWWQGYVVQGGGSTERDLTSEGHWSSWMHYRKGTLGIWHQGDIGQVGCATGRGH